MATAEIKTVGVLRLCHKIFAHLFTRCKLPSKVLERVPSRAMGDSRHLAANCSVSGSESCIKVDG